METMLITGGSGFLGRALAKRFSRDFDVILGSRNAKALRGAASETGVDFTPLDVAIADSTDEVFARYRPDVVIHAAATKFVDLAEVYPYDTLRANVLGSENVVRSAVRYGTKFTLGISTDKAAPPVANLYGMTKSIMERMFCSVGRYHPEAFGTVRYGNVAWSTGSVFPIWQKMLQVDGHIVSTGPDLSRYFFSIDEAVDLIDFSLRNRGVVASNVLVRPLKGLTMRRVLDIWTQSVGATWEQGTPRRGDRREEFLVGMDEGSDAFLTLLEGKEHILIDPGSRQFEDAPLEPISSRTATQLTDEEISDLIGRSDDS